MMDTGFHNMFDMHGKTPAYSYVTQAQYDYYKSEGYDMRYYRVKEK